MGKFRWVWMAAMFLVAATFQNCGKLQSPEFGGGTSASSADSQSDSADNAASVAGPAPAPNPAPAPPPYSLKVQSRLVTAAHRYAPTAYGGWGPHLGHLLRSAKNELWFVDDTGNDVTINAGAAYYKLVNGVWSQAGFQAFPGVVQQNTGSVMSGNTIYTYGIDVQNSRVVECYFSTEQTYYGCNHLPFDTGAAQNYVGATISPSGTRVVWWSGSGTFSYIYNYGGGWNGPVVSTVAGYAGFAYVYGRIGADNASLELVGAAPKASGGADVGYSGAYGHALLGNAMNWVLLEITGTGLESWMDANGGTHLITYGSVEPKVFYKPKGGALAYSTTVGMSGVVGARFVQSKDRLHLVLSMADGKLYYKHLPLANAVGPINWPALSASEVSIPAGLGVLSLYPESPMYQTAVPSSFNLGLNGYNNQGSVFHVSD